MSDARIAITGATGRLGGMVARRLSEWGLTQRLVVRDARRAPALRNAQVSVASYDDRDALMNALTGIETLLFVSASESPSRLEQHVTLIEVAAAAGVQHVVYTSFFGAAPDATFTLARDHWATEQRLQQSRLGFTSIRG